MAAEITIRASLVFHKGSGMDGVDPGELSVTMTGSRYLHGRQSIGTSEEPLVLGEVPAGGWLWIRNLDATNYVVMKGAAAAVALPRMRAGEPAMFRLDANATAPVLQATVAACLVEYLLLED